MYTSIEHVALLLAAGAGTGVLGALLGTGGGVFLIPMLVLGLGISMHHAVATSIISVIATSSAVASANVEHGAANMRLGMTLEIATALGAIAGGLTAGWLEPSVLEGLFAVVLVPTAVLMWRSAIRGRPSTTTSGTDEQPREQPAVRAGEGPLEGRYYDVALGRVVTYHVHRLWAALGVCFVAGNLSGLLGIGGGVFKVPALHLLSAVPIKAAAATSNFMIGVTATASAFLYFGRDDVLPGLTASVVLGVLAGSAIGHRLNRIVRGRLIKRLFALLLLAVAVQMLIRVLF